MQVPYHCQSRLLLKVAATVGTRIADQGCTLAKIIANNYTITFYTDVIDLYTSSCFEFISST